MLPLTWQQREQKRKQYRSSSINIYSKWIFIGTREVTHLLQYNECFLQLPLPFDFFWKHFLSLKVFPLMFSLFQRFHFKKPECLASVNLIGSQMIFISNYILVLFVFRLMIRNAHY